MDGIEVKPVAICVVCKCAIDLNAPYAIVKSDYAHLDCADAYDRCEWGREFKQKEGL